MPEEGAAQGRAQYVRACGPQAGRPAGGAGRQRQEREAAALRGAALGQPLFGPEGNEEHHRAQLVR